jgi:hypothetical protein
VELTIPPAASLGAERIGPGSGDKFTLMTQLQMRLGVIFPHMTELERFAYQRGGYTDQIWAGAGFGEQDRRYDPSGPIGPGDQRAPVVGAEHPMGVLNHGRN